MQASVYRLNQKAPHILTLIIISSFASMGAVILTPALPKIAHYFHISENISQLTVTLFLLGYALGQLIYGPLSNRFGRKKAFFIGVSIATFGTLMSIIAEPLNSFWFLIAGRCLEALGSSAGLVISFTIINDHYFPQQARKVISYLTLAFAIIPGVATLIGGTLISYFSWAACFYFLLVYGLVLSVPAALLAETALVLNPSALRVRHIKQSYRDAFYNPTLRHFSLFLGLNTMGIYVYAASAPFIAIHNLGYSPQFFGIVGLIPFIGTALGSITSAKLSGTFSPKYFITLAMIAEGVAALIMTLCFALGYVNLFVLIGSGFIFMFGACLVISNAASLATSALEDKATGSAVMNFLNLSLPVSGTFVLALVPGSELIKLPLIFIVGLILMGLMWKKMWRSALHSNHLK